MKALGIVIVSVVLLAISVETFFHFRHRRNHDGPITYVCSPSSQAVDYSPKTIGPAELRITKLPHPGTFPTWTVAWPGRMPIKATSFQLRTGSFGGSQGIKWREPDGRQMIASLSFSDLVTENGPNTIWVELTKADEHPSDTSSQIESSTKFTCGPDH